MTRLIVLAASLIAALPASSQEARAVTFRTICYKHLNDVTTLSLPSSGGKKGAEVPLLTGGFSEDLKASFAGGMASFTVDETDPASGKVVPKVIAKGKLASGDRQVFLFLPATDKSLTYQVHAMNDDEKAFPMGSTRVINLAPIPIRLNLAGADLPPVKAGDTVIYPPVKKADDWGMYTARIDFENGKGGWVPVATQSWKSSERKRDMVITMLDIKTRQPSIKLYQDVPPWREIVLPVGGKQQ